MSDNKQQHNTIVDIAQQVTEGNIPSNDQIKGQLDPLKDKLENAEKKATGTEAEAFHQTKELVSAVEKTLDSKNAGDKLQKLAAAAARVAERTSTPTPSGQVWDETKEFVATMKDLAMNLVMSKAFRQSLMDFFQILIDITNIETDKIDASGKAKEGFVEGKPVEAAKDVAGKAMDIVQNLPDEIPEEQRRKLRENLRKLLSQLREDADTGYAFRKFLRLTSLIQKEIAARVASTQVDKDVREVEELAADLIDSFLEGKSIHQLIERVKTVVERIQSDEELDKLIRDSRDLLERAFQNPELIDSDSFYDDADKLYKRSRKLVKKYKEDRSINKMCDLAQELLKTFKSDDTLNELQYRMGKVAESMTYTDIKGQTHIDFDLVAAMRKELVPFLIDRIDEVPIPGFIITSEDFEYIKVNDLYCKLGDIMPDKIHIRAMNDTDLTMTNFKNPVKSESYIKFHMEGLRPQFKDFYFTFKKKGMVKLEDEGRASLKITGDGIVVDMQFELVLDKDNHTVLGKHKAEVKADRISLDIEEAEHKVLLNIISTLFAPQLKRAFEVSLKSKFESIGNDWSMYINKRVLSTLPTITEIGEKITTSAIPPLQVLGEAKITKANA